MENVKMMRRLGKRDREKETGGASINKSLFPILSYSHDT